MSKRSGKQQSISLVDLRADSFHVDPIDISVFNPVLESMKRERTPWREKPPSPHEFIHSRDFLGRPNLYPAIQEDMEIIFSGPDYMPICEIFLDDEGLGSGKSVKMSAIASYLITWVLHLWDIEKYFKLEEGLTKLAIYNMAPNAKVAKDIVFSRYQNLLVNMKWFRDNGITIDRRIESQIVFENKPLVIRPGNSSQAFDTGYDTFGGMIDECAADGGFETKDKDNFQDLFEGMNSRRKSRFVDCPHKGLIVCASSAGTENRAFEKMMTEAELIYLDNPQYNPKTDPVQLGGGMGKVLIRRRSSFDANPHHQKYFTTGQYFEHTVARELKGGRKINYRVKITNEYRRPFDTNPHKVLRNMCAIPSLAISQFFSEWDKVLACVELSQRVDPYPNKIDEYGFLVEVSPPQVWRDLPDHFHGIQGVLYYCHVDLALSGDGCGLAIGHRGPNRDYNGLPQPTVVIDLALCFQGSIANKIKIAEVKQFLIDMAIKRRFRFGKITFDNFQSAGTIQELQEMKYDVEKKSVTKESFEVLMELLYDSRVDWYYDEWALGEAKRLEDKGNIVEKSIGSTDDEIECVARVCEEAIGGKPLENLPQQRAYGFSSKSGMPGGQHGNASGGDGARMQMLNPQLRNNQPPRAYGFSRQTRVRKMPQGMGGFGGRR